MYGLTKTKHSTNNNNGFLGSDALVRTACLVAVLASFSALHPASSFTVQQHQASSVLNSRWSYEHTNCKKNGICNRLHMSYQQPTPEDKKPDTSSSSIDEEKEQTLYEILRASPTADRSELKRQYITMARASHPDAQIGKTSNADEDDVEFQKVAEAWKILGNPKSRKRYDRELKAKAWGERAQRLTNERLEQVAPVASKIMDNLAVPFLRRTSATTYAVGKAIADGLGSSSTSTPAPAPTAASTPPSAPKQTPSKPSVDTKTGNTVDATTADENKNEIEAKDNSSTRSVDDQASTSTKSVENIEEEIEIKNKNNNITVLEETKTDEATVITSPLVDSDADTITASTDVENQPGETIEDPTEELNEVELEEL